MAYIRRGNGMESETAAAPTGAAPASSGSYSQNPIPTTTAVLKGVGSGGIIDGVPGTDFAPGGGLSDTYPVDATVSGSITSLTFTNGVLTGTTTLP